MDFPHRHPKDDFRWKGFGSESSRKKPSLSPNDNENK